MVSPNRLTISLNTSTPHYNQYFRKQKGLLTILSSSENKVVNQKHSQKE